MVLKIGCDEDKSLKDCEFNANVEDLLGILRHQFQAEVAAQEKLRQQWRADEKKYARKRLMWNEDKAKMETSMRNWLAVMATSTSDLEERTRQHQLDEKDHQKDLFLWDCAREAQKVQQAQWEKEKEKHKHEVLEWEETKRKMEQEFEAYARKEKEHQQKQTQWMEEDKKHKKKKIQWTKEEVQHSLKRLMWANEDRKHQQQRDVWLAEEKAHHSETQAREKEKEALVKLRQQWRKEENYREQTYELADNKTELLKYKHLMETREEETTNDIKTKLEYRTITVREARDIIEYLGCHLVRTNQLIEQLVNYFYNYSNRTGAILMRYNIQKTPEDYYELFVAEFKHHGIQERLKTQQKMLYNRLREFIRIDTLESSESETIDNPEPS